MQFLDKLILGLRYPDLSKSLPRDVRRASDVMKSQIKLLANKTWHYVTLEYFLNDKFMYEVVSSMNVITNLSTQEIIRQNKCQMRSLDKLVLK